MTRPAILAGASLVIALNPTGLRSSSPIVCSRYVIVNHIGLTCPPWRAGIIRIANPAATKMSDQANFAGLDGSLPTSPRRSHNHANTGASIQRKSEFIDWNQLLGNGKPAKTLLVLRS